MLRKNLLVILLAGLVGFGLGFFIRMNIESNKFVLAAWENDPVVIICPDSHITSYRVALAMEWWGIRGHEFAYYHFDEDNKICSKGLFITGVVFIRGEGELLPDTYAVTTRLAIAGKMKAASITLPNENKFMPRLLEHELGHALGFLHYNMINHLMNQKWTMGGWDKNGLENRHR
jgi:hypothetical protein